MKRKIKPGTGLYAYLESNGILTTGNDHEIKRAKKSYWTEYRKQWKKNRRQQSKTYVLLFSFSEQRIINKKASALKISPVRFIKQSVLEASGSLGPTLVGNIRESIILFHSAVCEILETETRHDTAKERIFEETDKVQGNLFSILNLTRYDH